jgi:hypothetical protein
MVDKKKVRGDKGWVWIMESRNLGRKAGAGLDL